MTYTGARSAVEEAPAGLLVPPARSPRRPQAEPEADENEEGTNRHEPNGRRPIAQEKRKEKRNTPKPTAKLRRGRPIASADDTRALGSWSSFSSTSTNDRPLLKHEGH